MHSKTHSHGSTLGMNWSPANAVLTLLLVLLFLIFLILFMTLTAEPVQGQTFTVIHSFTGGDGANPYAGLTMDASGDLYGTTHYMGTYGAGNVFRLRHYTEGWVLTPLYNFTGGNDGSQPAAGVTIGRDGTLYGTTEQGGAYQCGQPGVNCGVVYNLRPPATAPRSAVYSWNETVLWSFTGGADGGYPNGDLIFDQAGNIYGTDWWGGYEGYGEFGAVYQLTPSGGTWTETTLYSPTNDTEGQAPENGVIFDRSGNLYGVFGGGEIGINGWGAVYELSPSGSGWRLAYLYVFPGQNGSVEPFGGLILDSSGNLYGATAAGGADGYGTVFELTPGNSGWTFNQLYSLPTCDPPACGPRAGLVMDGSGNLYGTTYAGGANRLGSVFKLSPSGSFWTYTSLHDFNGGSDGAYPLAPVMLDAQGNLYGTAADGGASGDGVVWEITP